MNKSLLNFSVVLLMILAVSSVNAQKTATVSGNWNNVATWGGAPAPTSADDVVINNGVTVTVNVAAQCNSVTFRSASGSLTVNTGMTLDVTTSVTLENTAAANTAATLAGAGTINCAAIVVGGNVTLVTGNNLTNTLTSSVTSLNVSGNILINGEDNVNAESNATFSITTGSLTVGGVITLDSDNDGNSATAAFTMANGGANGVLDLTAATPFSTTGLGTETINFGTGTNAVNYSGTAQTVAPATYRNLILSGSGAKTTTGVTVGLKLSLQGTATVGNAITYSTAILEYKGSAAQTTSNNEFAASTSNIDEVIVDNAAGVTLNGTKTLNGDLTLTNGTLTAGTNLTMGAGGTPLITRSEGSLIGTLQGVSDYDVTFTGNSKTTGPELNNGGLGTVIISLSAAQTLTLDANRTPDGNLTISAGTFDLSTFTINRSVAGGTLTVSNGATLRIGGTNAFPGNYSTHAIGSTSPFSTVEYAGTAQTITTLNGTQSYGHLILSGSGVKSFTGETVNGTLSIQGTATTAGTSPVYGAAAILEYKGSSAQNTSNVEFVGTGANPVNVTIDNTNGVTLNAAKAINGALTLTNGYLTTTNALLLTINNAGSASTANGAFVNGPLSKVKNTTTLFTFPVGNLTGGLRTIGVTPQTTTASTYRATFNSASPKTSVGNNLGTLAQISGCEYWDLSQTAGTTATKVTLSWPAAANSCGQAYVGVVSSLVVAHFSGGTWTNEGQSASSGTPSAGGTVTSANNLTSFSPFALGTTNATQNPLPVMFADVKAFQKNSGVQIDWSNLTERDLIGYTVERSANGQSFTAINQQAPRSNMNDKESYSAYDATPLAGVNYYRVKVLEVSGKIIYSKVLKVDLSGKQAGISLYPNPVNGNQVSVSFNVKQGQYIVKVLNGAGQQVYSQKLVHQGGSMTQTVELPSSVKPGVYNMMVTGDNYRESKMFIVQ